MTAALNLGLLGNNVNSSGQVSLTAGVFGTLPVANGGTGLATLPANNVLLGNGTSTLQSVAPSTSGNVLLSNGTTWTSGVVPVSVPSTFDAIGSLVIAINGTTSNFFAGNTVAGSSLYYPTTINAGSVGGTIYTQNTTTNPPYAIFEFQTSYSRRVDGSNPGWVAAGCTALSGTWRVLGTAPARTYTYDGTYFISFARGSACLVQRIA